MIVYVLLDIQGFYANLALHSKESNIPKVLLEILVDLAWSILRLWPQLFFF